MEVPWAEKLRPQRLEDFVGQEHLVGEGKPLRVAIEAGHKFSFILWGPPGVGKTTLARIYANSLGLKWVEMSAVAAGKRDMREEIESGGDSLALFVDEIHRFSKAQQDFLLPYVEKGKVILIGATTENPSFEVIAPLLSRCRVLALEGLGREEFRKIRVRMERELGIKITDEVCDCAAGLANGDVRQFIGLIEAAHTLYGQISADTLVEVAQSKRLRYDRAGEEHYNTVSAFIKSMRAGNADAAIYYLARMVEAGEDPLFIARRMVIFASEDIGLAQPTALVVANSVFRACETVGYPECAINLAHGAAYLAGCKKDRRVYGALGLAREDVQRLGNLPIPMKLRNAATKLMKSWGYAEGYQMYDEGELLPEELKGRKYFDRR